jgi:DNA (cytosine-5)-methyltransferase 1
METGYDSEMPKSNTPKFTFVDLFAGIGGMRIAAQKAGGTCVQSVEVDDAACETYETNFQESPKGDVTKLVPRKRKITSHDITLAGFPCQAFSLAGKRGGFADTRGTLFRDVAEILRHKRPKAFVLENVKGLIGHDKGRTLETILNVLESPAVGYTLPEIVGPKGRKQRGWFTLNALEFGLPQSRERIFIIGFRDPKAAARFRAPAPRSRQRKSSLIEILEDGPRYKRPVPARHFLSAKLLAGLKKHKLRHAKKGNGFGFAVRSHNEHAGTLVIGGMGKERNLVKALLPAAADVSVASRGPRNREGLRRLTPREWARLQGFPESFKLHPRESQAYKQLGNSVAIPVVTAVVSSVVKALNLKARPESVR